MNWPLKPRTENQTPPLEGHFPTFIEQWTASKRDAEVRSDSWNHTAKIEADIMEETYGALEGPKYRETPEFQQGLRTYGQTLAGGNGNPDPRDLQRLTFRLTNEQMFEHVQQARQFDPQAFGTLPGSQAELDAEINRRRQRELDDAAAVLRFSDSSIARFGGAMQAGLTDEWSVPFLAVGAPLEGTGMKAFARMVATEGAINAALEVPQVLKQRQVAKEMGFEPTNPAVQIGTAAAAGAAFSGVLGGVGRALGYAFGRRSGEAAALASERAGLEGELAVDAAETAMRNGKEPQIPQSSAINFAAYEQKYGLPEGYLGRTAQLESRGNPRAQNPNSSAGGLFQFVDRTARDYGLTNRFDPTEATDAAARLARDNAATLRNTLGRDPTAAELYLAHQQGAAGAARLLANPDAPAVDIVGAEAVRLNGGVADMSARDFANLWIARYQSATTAYVTDFPSTGGEYRGGGSSFGGFEGGVQRRVTLPNEMVTPAGTRVPVRYRVVDMAELKAASGDLQPRDRSRAASDEQIAEIAARLDPERLMPAVETDRGAPLVGPDMMVESGNGRVAALNRAATENPQAYAAYVARVREQFDIPEGVDRPVLIAERVGEMTPEARRALVRESNVSSIGRMAPSEQARLEAGYLNARSFDAYQSGKGLNAPENAGFVRRMMSLMPQTERAAMLTAEGRLNIDGIRRIRQALFARAFEADDLLKMVAETESPAIEGMLRMLEDVAPDWAAFRAMVEAGYVRAEFDVTTQLMEVVRMIARARTEGRDGQSVIAAIRDRLAQGDMFGENDPMTAALLEVFYKGDRPRTAEASKEILRRYAAEATLVGRADMQVLVGDAVTPLEALQRAVDGYDGRTAYTPARTPDVAAYEPPTAALGDIAAIDTTRFDAGAAGASVERADDVLATALREDQTNGPFGPMFSGFADNPEGAIAKIMAEGRGEVADAFTRPELGPIAFVHGKPDGKNGRGGFGLAHIAQDRSTEMLNDLPRILREGTVYADPKGLPRAYIVTDEAPAHFAVVRLQWDGQSKAWIVTAIRDEVGEFDPRGQWEAFRRTGIVETRAPVSPEDLARQAHNATAPAKDMPPLAEIQDEAAQALDEAKATWADQRQEGFRLGGEDAPQVTVGEVLDDLDADQNLISAMTSCAMKGVL